MNAVFTAETRRHGGTIMKERPPRRGAAFWIVLIAAVNAIHAWLFFHLPSASTVQFGGTIAIHVVACFGPFWMLADWFIRRGKKLKWQRWMWLFFVPWGFLWYVFSKWEPRRLWEPAP